jgi:hypothetical protein
MHRTYQLLAITLASIGLAVIVVANASCHHDGLVPAMVDGQLNGCVAWAQEHGDAELEALCRAGKPLPAVLDLFLVRQMKAADAGADQ